VSPTASHPINSTLAAAAAAAANDDDDDTDYQWLHDAQIPPTGHQLSFICHPHPRVAMRLQSDNCCKLSG